MKLINIKTLLSVTLLAGVVTSCKKTDLYPYDSIELSQSFKTMNDARAWNTNTFAQLRGRVGGSYDFSQDVQADQLNASAVFGNRNGNPHRWEGFLSDDGALSGPWGGYYNGITNCNLTIAGLPTIPTTTQAEADSVKKYVASAYLARAYYYFNLIIRFAKPFEPATAATDLGVPLVLVYDVNLKPARATVKEVYDQILLDIAEAKTGLTGTQAVAAGAVRFNINAALALEARVRLNMQDWAGAKTAADAVIATGTYPLITSQANFNSMWKNDLGTEVIMQTFLSQGLETGNTVSSYLLYQTGTATYSPDFYPSQWVIDMYEANDIRKAAYFADLPVTVNSISTTATVVNKFPGNPALFTSNVTNYQNSVKVFRVAEMYLISAEAAYRATPSNEAAALISLNALRTARGLSAVSVSGAALFQAIKAERFRELAFEGFRLFDLKRWHEGFSRHDPQNVDLITEGPNYDQLTIAADNPKFVWGIPTRDVTINGNLVQNPGW